MAARHSFPIRGLTTAARSPLFQGRFGRIFRSLPAATYGADDAQSAANLTALGTAMSSSPDDPKDGPDDEESGIPALYTYFGQFIDHDLTFDPVSSLARQNDPDALTDYRTPAFDLDCVYGRGPDDQPYLYDGGRKFLLGDPLTGGDAGARDLPRNNANPRRALIGDPRNDENAIVSQFQGLLLRFHNRMADENPDAGFEDLQKMVRFHYQYVVVNDFLPRVVDSGVLAQLKSGDQYDSGHLRFYRPRNEPYMPVEFSVAAYRLGHSMIRPGYRLNDNTLLPIFPALAGFTGMVPTWGIDWGRFIDLDQRKYDGTDADKQHRLQFAYRIDTSLVNPLANLPPNIAANPASLAQRNLLRGWRLGLPSGQAVARAMGVQPLPDRSILIGKAVDKPEHPLGDIVSLGGPAFRNNCPLWTYILAEAMHHQAAVKLPVVTERRRA